MPTDAASPLRDLELAWQDMERQDALYRPSVCWRDASRYFVEQLRANGPEAFRSTEVANGFFSPTYGPPSNSWSRAEVDALEAWHATTTPSAKQRMTLVHLLRGGAHALADFRVLTAADDPARLPRLDRFSESGHGQPWEQFEFEGRRFSRSALNYLLGLAFLKRHLGAEVPQVVLEIGGGFGTLGEILASAAIPGCRYIDIDIPPTQFVAQSYLSAVVGPENVSTYADTRDLDVIDLSALRPFSVLCPWQLPKLQGQVDLFVNFISFQEMEPDIVENYLRHVDRLGARHVLLRNLREGKQAIGPGVSFGVEVPTVASDYDRFLSGYGLIATNVIPFGSRTIDGFHSELRLYRRQA